jgi:hypothetical protein
MLTYCLAPRLNSLPSLNQAMGDLTHAQANCQEWERDLAKWIQSEINRIAGLAAVALGRCKKPAAVLAKYEYLKNDAWISGKVNV